MWGIPLRSHGEAVQPSGRRPCPDSLELRAYALGFTWGDLAVDEKRGDGSTVSVRGSTTHQRQVDLVVDLFEPFGRVTVSRGAGSTYVRASLDESFTFLRHKYDGVVPEWIAGAGVEAAFAAGYIDAEGSSVSTADGDGARSTRTTRTSIAGSPNGRRASVCWCVSGS
jgi:hypothetical protein